MGLLQSIKTALRSSWGSYADATLPSPDRGNVFYYLPSDSRHYVDNWQRTEILRKVEWLFQSFGVMKEAVRGIARHTVGKGICASLNTDDEEWNALAEADLEAFFMSPSRVHLSGRKNAYEIQTLAVCQRMKQGEFLAAIVPNPRWGGAPCVQIFDALEVETPPNEGNNPYFVDGFELDANHCPKAIHVRGLGGGYTRIEWGNVIHWMHGDGVNQVRAVSEFAQAVAPLMDTRELIRLVSKTAKQNSAFGLLVKRMAKVGGQGALNKIQSLGMQVGQFPSGALNEEAQYEKVAGGGGIIYTDTEGDAKFLTPNSPSPLVEPFIKNVLMRDGLSSVGGASADFFWACADLSGAGQRFILAKADVFFTTLGDSLIGHLCNPLAVRYLMHRMETGKLRRPKVKVESGEGEEPTLVEDAAGEWMNHIQWQLPARISIDRADAVVEIQQLSNGIETLASINDRRGRGWRGMTKQWLREIKFTYEEAVKMGIPWAMSLWRASVPGAAAAQPDGQQEANQEEEPTPPKE